MIRECKTKRGDAPGALAKLSSKECILRSEKNKRAETKL